jgi:hypothetical protein
MVARAFPCRRGLLANLFYNFRLGLRDGQRALSMRAPGVAFDTDNRRAEQRTLATGRRRESFWKCEISHILINVIGAGYQRG